MSSATTEFDAFLARTHEPPSKCHPDDVTVADANEIDEQTEFNNTLIEKALHMPTLDHLENSKLSLPPASFDSGYATGVKGVIADARSYESAKQSRTQSNSRDDTSEDEFLQKWRESRIREFQYAGHLSVPVHCANSNTQVYGNFDRVDALGYLEAIEQVSRETVVVVFIYDQKCEVSIAVEAALSCIVACNPMVHFVKVDYEEIDFDNAGVPAILAYKNRGDLFANLTGLIEMIPDDVEFNSSAIEQLLHDSQIL